MFNSITLAGRLVKDPILRYTPSGKAVANIRLATATKVKDKEETLFINVVAFGKLAETVREYLSKGRPVMVQGRLRQRQTEQYGIRTEVVANKIVFLPGSNGKATANPVEITDTEPF